MKRIFAYIGSRKGRHSNTYYIAQKIQEAIKTLDVENSIHFEIVCANEVAIKHCESCNSCFMTGQCKLDNDDDMRMIKEKMLMADFIILGSPVFAHNVSSDTKAIIDRIAYWLHLMRLTGKCGSSISVSSGNGNRNVDVYLEKIYNLLGITRLHSISECCFDLTEDGQIEEGLKGRIENYAQEIYQVVMGQKAILPSDLQNRIFELLKEHYDEEGALNTCEYQYWKDNGYFECQTFNELYQLRRD